MRAVRISRLDDGSNPGLGRCGTVFQEHGTPYRGVADGTVRQSDVPKSLPEEALRDAGHTKCVETLPLVVAESSAAEEQPGLNTGTEEAVEPCSLGEWAWVEAARCRGES